MNTLNHERGNTSMTTKKVHSHNTNDHFKLHEENTPNEL